MLIPYSTIEQAGGSIRCSIASIYGKSLEQVERSFRKAGVPIISSNAVSESSTPDTVSDIGVSSLCHTSLVVDGLEDLEDMDPMTPSTSLSSETVAARAVKGGRLGL